MTFYHLKTLLLLKNFQERMMHHCLCLHHTTRRDHIISFWVSVTDIIWQGKGGGLTFCVSNLLLTDTDCFISIKDSSVALQNDEYLIIPLLHAGYFDFSTLFSIISLLPALHQIRYFYWYFNPPCFGRILYLDSDYNIHKINMPCACFSYSKPVLRFKPFINGSFIFPLLFLNA